VARVQATTSGLQESVGQARQLSFHNGAKPRFAQELEVYPNVWSGFGLIRGGPGIALVGSPESVAARSTCRPSAKTTTAGDAGTALSICRSKGRIPVSNRLARRYPARVAVV
jgi:hypothetical protein